MKTSKAQFLVTTMMAGACVSSTTPATAGAPDDAITAAVRAYVKGGDAQDRAKVEEVTHTSFRVIASMGGAGDVSFMSRDDYLGLLDAKKIGGTPRTVKVEWTKSMGNVANAKVQLESKAARFDSLFTLVKKDGRWVVVEDVVRFDKKG